MGHWVCFIRSADTLPHLVPCLSELGLDVSGLTVGVAQSMGRRSGYETISKPCQVSSAALTGLKTGSCPYASRD